MGVSVFDLQIFESLLKAFDAREMQVAISDTTSPLSDNLLSRYVKFCTFFQFVGVPRPVIMLTSLPSNPLNYAVQISL
jgi:hypothetical protein